MFSFQQYDKMDTTFWSELVLKLPDNYHYPDPAFLLMQDPLLFSFSFIKNPQSLIPGYELEDADLWQSLTSKLPNNYSIPDTAVIKRLCEI